MNRDYKNRNDDEVWLNELRSRLHDYEEPFDTSDWKDMEEHIAKTCPDVKSTNVSMHRRSRVWWYAAAAVVFLCFISGVYLFLPDERTNTRINISKVVPTGNTLNNSKNIALADSSMLSSARLKRQANKYGVVNAVNKKSEKVVDKVSAVYRADVLPSQGNMPDRIKSDENLTVEGKKKEQYLSENKEKEQLNVEKSKSNVKERHVYHPIDKRLIEKIKYRKHYSVGLLAGISAGMDLDMGSESDALGSLDVPFPYTTSNNIVYPSKVLDNYAGYTFKHHQPISFGLSISKDMGYHLSIESGVIYTCLSSDATYTNGSKTELQLLHYIGVPLKGSWSFYSRSPFQVYVSAGAMIEKCIYGTLGSKKLKENPLQFSIEGDLGAQYNVNNRFAIYAETSMTHYYADGSNIATIRKDTPNIVGLRLGVRLMY